MIYIGTDILSIDKLINSINKTEKKIIKKIFTEKEEVYCNSKRFPYIHYAGKFAAKESIKKAILSSRLVSMASLKKIEIINDESGKPYPIIHYKNLKSFNFQLSISHTDQYAIAFAVMTNDTSIKSNTII